MLQYVYRFSVLKGKSGSFIEWINENDQNFREHSAEGWHYLGTWFIVRGFGDYQAEMRWDLDDYAALGAGFGDAVNQRLLNEFFTDFLDEGAPAQAYLLKGSTVVESAPGT